MKRYSATPFRSSRAVAVVLRRPGFIMANVAVPSGLIAALSVVPFALEPDEHAADRLGLGVVFILTMVSFKTAVSSYKWTETAELFKKSRN